jgi:hypothetical protein
VLCVTAGLTAADRRLGDQFPLGAAIILPWLSLPIFFAVRRELGFWPEAGLWLLGIFASLVGYGVNEAAKGERQRRRDDIPSAILRALRSSTQLPVDRYAVYARPFDSTDQLTTQNMDVQAGGGGQQPTHVDLETKLTRALEPYLPVVALGRPGEMVGVSGRVRTSESEWQDAFALLAANAVLILVLPSRHLGTRWEMEWLLNKARDQCIFIMPMSPTPRLSYRDNWEEVKVSLKELGVELPIYQNRGALFRLDSEGHPTAVADLPGWPVTIPSLRRALVTAAPVHLGLTA